MDFGKLSDISKVKFSLPPDHRACRKNLARFRDDNRPLHIYVGCPTWKEKCYIDKIYPPHARDKEYLRYYAKQFNTIELNSTYYGIPKISTIEQWKQSATANFKFCPKLPGEITEHQLEEAEACTEAFCDVICNLHEFLGTAFLLLPPDFSPASSANLQNYLTAFPPQVPLAVEFRHPAWFYNKNCDAIFEFMQHHDISPVITDVAGRRDVLHQCLTTDTVLIRFVGNDLDASDYKRIDDWVARIKTWLELGLKKVYFFVHQHKRELAIDLAIYLVTELNKHCQLDLHEPQLLKKQVQQTFFEL